MRIEYDAGGRWFNLMAGTEQIAQLCYEHAAEIFGWWAVVELTRRAHRAAL